VINIAEIVLLTLVSAHFPFSFHSVNMSVLLNFLVLSKNNS